MLSFLSIWLKLAAAVSLWDRAIEAQPLPGKRDLENRDYFVIEVSDPEPLVQANEGWTTEEPFPIRDHWLLSAPAAAVSDHRLARRDAALLMGATSFYHSEPSKLRRRAPVPNVQAIRQEFGISDPLFDHQWFIYNPEEEGHDMNVTPVWRRNITGEGVTVAIVDDGLDYDHPDFEDSFSLAGSWDYNLHQQHPKPVLDVDTHGTRCAGEVAAGINNACGVGIAPGAKVAGIRILSGSLSSTDEARALIHRNQINDIYSCSWGPSDDGMTIDGPPPLVKRAEVDGIENGRGGKGSIYVVASGNGDQNGDNCNYDGYTNSIYSITVAAIDRQNRHPYYAESCSANLVVTYSSNAFEKISTTDRLDPAAPNDPKCTENHSGTSAAAPIAAGVFALVLQQRPDLTWRDLQYLVRDTAKYFDIVPTNPPTSASLNWMRTADGHFYHNSYGYGLLDADEIVRRAETWELVKPQSWLILDPINTRKPITPTTELKQEVSKKEWHEANLEHIEHVRVRVSYHHENRGQLTFILESPAGIISELASPRPRDISNEEVKDWEFLSVIHWGETGPGVWKLRVHSPEGFHGIITKWQLKFFGQAKDAHKAKRYSEVWSQYEDPEPVVKDPIEAGTHTLKTIATPGPSTKRKTKTKTRRSTAEAPTTTTTTTSTPAEQATDAPEPTQTDSNGKENENNNGEEKKAGPHSVLFYIAVSAAGVGVLGLILIPTIYFGCWKRKSVPTSYVQLDEDDAYELDDAFEIEDESQDEGEQENSRDL